MTNFPDDDDAIFIARSMQNIIDQAYDSNVTALDALLARIAAELNIIRQILVREYDSKNNDEPWRDSL